MNSLKKILKNTSFLVAPTLGSVMLMMPESAQAEIGAVSAKTLRMHNVVSDKVVVNNSAAAEKFMKMTQSLKGNVQQRLLNDTTMLTSFEGKIGHATFETGKNNAIVEHGYTLQIKGGETFVAQVTAPFSEVRGRIDATQIQNLHLISAGSISLANGSEIDVANLTVQAGKAIKDINYDTGKMNLITADKKAILTMQASASISSKGMSAFVAPNMALAGHIAANVIQTVSADKVQVDMYDGLITFEAEKGSLENARKLGAKFTGKEDGLVILTSGEALAVVQGAFNLPATGTKAVLKAGEIVIGSGSDFTYVNADVTGEKIAVKGTEYKVISGTVINSTSDLLIGGDWHGEGNKPSDIYAKGLKESGKEVSDIYNSFTIARDENSLLGTIQEGVTLNVGHKGVVWSGNHETALGGITVIASPLVAKSENAYLEVSGLSVINPGQINDTSKLIQAPKGAFVLFDPKNIVITGQPANAVDQTANIEAELEALRARVAIHAGGNDSPMVKQMIGAAADGSAINVLAGVGTISNLGNAAGETGDLDVGAFRNGAANAAMQFANKAAETTFFSAAAGFTTSYLSAANAGQVAFAATTANQASTGAVAHFQASNDIYVTGDIAIANDSAIVLEAGRSIYLGGNTTLGVNSAFIVHANSSRATVANRDAGTAYIIMAPSTDVGGPVNAATITSAAGVNRVTLAMDVGNPFAGLRTTAKRVAGDIVVGRILGLDTDPTLLVVSHWGDTGNVVPTIGTNGGALRNDSLIRLRNAGDGFLVSLGTAQSQITENAGTGYNAFNADTGALIGVSVGDSTGAKNWGYQSVLVAGTANYAFPWRDVSTDRTKTDGGTIGQYTLAGVTYGLRIDSSDGAGSVAAIVPQGGSIYLKHTGDQSVNIGATLGGVAEILGVGEGSYGLYTKKGDILFDKEDNGSDIQIADADYKTAPTFGYNNAGTGGSGGSVRTDSGKVILKSGRDILDGNGAPSHAIVGDVVALVAGRAVGTDYTDANSIWVKSDNLVTSAIGNALNLNLIGGITKANTTLGYSTGIAVEGIDANGIAIAAVPANALKKITTTANDLDARIKSTVGGFNFAAIANGANTDSAFNLHGNASAFLQSVTSITADQGAFILLGGNGSVSLNALGGDIGSLTNVVGVSLNGGYLNALAANVVNGAASTGSVYLGLKSNMTLGGADVANAVALAVVDNISVTGKGNVYIDGGKNELTLANNAGAVSAVDGTIFLHAGNLVADGGGNAGFTGSKFSINVDQDSTNDVRIGATGDIGTNALKIKFTAVGAYGSGAGNENAFLEINTTSGGLANASQVYITLANNRIFQVNGSSVNSLAQKSFSANPTANAAVSGINVGNDALVNVTLADGATLLLGTTGATELETGINAPFGAIQFVFDNGGPSFVKVASEHVYSTASLLTRTGGAVGALLGETGLFASGANKRFRFTPTSASGDADGTGLGILSGVFTGNDNIQVWGNIAYGTSADVAAGAGTKGSPINYGLFGNNGVAALIPYNAAATSQVTGGHNLYVVDENGKAAGSIYISHTSVDALNIPNANSAVLNAGSIGYWVNAAGTKGDGFASLNDNTGRILVGNGSKLALLAANIGSWGVQKVGTTANISENFRLKIGSTNAGAGLVFGQASGEVHLHVYNDDVVPLQFGIGAAALPPPVNGIEDWTNGAVAGTAELRNFDMGTSTTSKFSLTATDTVNRNNISFVGDAALKALNSQGQVAILTYNANAALPNLAQYGSIIGLANTSIAANILMLKALSIGAAGAPAVPLRVSLVGDNPWIGVATTGGVAWLGDANNSNLVFGKDGATAATDSIGGIFVGGFNIVSGGNASNVTTTGTGNVTFNTQAISDHALNVLVANGVLSATKGASLGVASAWGSTAKEISLAGPFALAANLTATAATSISVADGFAATGAGVLSLDATNKGVSFLGTASFAGGLSVRSHDDIVAEKGLAFTTAGTLSLISTVGTIGTPDVAFAVNTGTFAINNLILRSALGTNVAFSGTGAVTTNAAADAIQVTGASGDATINVGGNFTFGNANANVVSIANGNLKVASSGAASVLTFGGNQLVLNVPNGAINLTAHEYASGGADLGVNAFATKGLTLNYLGTYDETQVQLNRLIAGFANTLTSFSLNGADVTLALVGNVDFGGNITALNITAKTITGAQVITAANAATIALNTTGNVEANITAAANTVLSGTIGGNLTTTFANGITANGLTVKGTGLSSITSQGVFTLGSDLVVANQLTLDLGGAGTFVNGGKSINAAKLILAGAIGDYVTQTQDLTVAPRGASTVTNTAALNISAVSNLAGHAFTLTQIGDLTFTGVGALTSVGDVTILASGGVVTSATPATTVVTAANFIFGGTTKGTLKTAVNTFTAHSSLKNIDLDNTGTDLVLNASPAEVSGATGSFTTGAQALTLAGVQTGFVSLSFSSNVVDASLTTLANYKNLQTLGITTLLVAGTTGDTITFNDGTVGVTNLSIKALVTAGITNLILGGALTFDDNAYGAGLSSLSLGGSITDNPKASFNVPSFGFKLTNPTPVTFTTTAATLLDSSTNSDVSIITSADDLSSGKNAGLSATKITVSAAKTFGLVNPLNIIKGIVTFAGTATKATANFGGVSTIAALDKVTDLTWTGYLGAVTKTTTGGLTNASYSSTADVTLDDSLNFGKDATAVTLALASDKSIKGAFTSDLVTSATLDSPIVNLTGFKISKDGVVTIGGVTPAKEFSLEDFFAKTLYLTVTGDSDKSLAALVATSGTFKPTLAAYSTSGTGKLKVSGFAIADGVHLGTIDPESDAAAFFHADDFVAGQDKDDKPVLISTDPLAFGALRYLQAQADNGDVLKSLVDAVKKGLGEKASLLQAYQTIGQAINTVNDASNDLLRTKAETVYNGTLSIDALEGNKLSKSFWSKLIKIDASLTTFSGVLPVAQTHAFAAHAPVHGSTAHAAAHAHHDHGVKKAKAAPVAPTTAPVAVKR